VCSLWPPLDAPIDISVLMPRSEARSASNSARLLALWLPRTQLNVLGDREGTQTPAPFIERPGSAVLFPGLQGSEAAPSGIKHLIVPDGTWSQARRIERRWFARHDLPRVQLDDTWPSAYGLRRAPAGVCTFEATALALGVLENLTLARALLTRFAEWARRADWLKAGGHPERSASALLEWELQLAVHPASARLDALAARTSSQRAP
jgi:DTW domain-containing protein YfiP